MTKCIVCSYLFRADVAIVKGKRAYLVCPDCRGLFSDAHKLAGELIAAGWPRYST